MIEVAMPRLSDSMEAGVIISWLKHDGELVQAGDELVEIETDKATVTYVAEQAGVLRIVAAEGESIAVGGAIARLLDAQAARAAAADGPGPAGLPRNTPPPMTPTDAARAADPFIATPLSVSARDLWPNGAGDAPAAPIPDTAPTYGVATCARPQTAATPLARRIAFAHAVDLGALTGSGPRGMVTRPDVLRAIGVDVPVPPPLLPPPPPGHVTNPPVAAPARIDPSSDAVASAKGDTLVIELTRLQQVVARRMTHAKATIPEFHLQTDVVMTDAMVLRASLKESGADVPSLNDFVVRAAALALRRHPRANGSYREGRFELYSRVNVGLAVAADDALLVPTIFDADAKTLAAIASESRRLAARVRSGEIAPAELSGATFTVTNLGMYGMTAITPVINEPQAAILGVGASRSVAVIADGSVAERHTMTLTLSCDHRILYGADAAAFLSAIREVLERPLALLV